MDSSTNLIDNHHAFGDLAAQYPWLGKVEDRARNARIETLEQLHESLTSVHLVCAAHLRFPDSIVADCHLCKVLDDQAEMYWRSTVIPASSIRWTFHH